MKGCHKEKKRRSNKWLLNSNLCPQLLLFFRLVSRKSLGLLTCVVCDMLKGQMQKVFNLEETKEGYNRIMNE